MTFNRDVVIDEVIEGSVSHREGEDGLSRVDFLPSIRNYPVLDQQRQGTVSHFAMNAQSVTVHQRLTDSARYSAHTDLQASMFRDEFGNTLAELSFMVLIRSGSQRQEWSIVFYDCVPFRDMKSRTTVDARHMPIDFHDQPLGRARRCAGVGVICSEGEIPIAIHLRHGHQKRVDMNVLREEADRLTERVWNVVHDLAITILLPLLD